MVFYKWIEQRPTKREKMISIHYSCYVYPRAYAFGCYLFNVNL